MKITIQRSSISPKFLILALLFGTCGSPNKQLESEEQTLFVEGNNDWTIEGDAKWEFNNSEILGKIDSGFGYLVSKEVFKNFELTLEFNPDGVINSGIFLRCKTREPSAAECYEINIWDLHPNQDYRTGSIVTRAKPLEYVETLNKWSTYKMRCENNSIRAWIDGVLTADIEDSQLPEGYIAVQAAGSGQIKFRNISITTW